jgi:tRNA-dihydrouridine synthase
MELILAPIHGMTNAFYRNQYACLFGGMDIYFAPFIGISNMRKTNAAVFDDLLKANNTENLSIVPQLLGNNSADFSFFASTIVDMGYNEINWNIGCPYQKVARKKKGSGLLPYPDKIKEFLDNVSKKTTYELSIKMRLGSDNYEEGLKVIQVLNDYPLKSIIIHARTGSQEYSGQVDLEAFDALYSLSRHSITYNGDIYTLADYKRIQERFPSINSFMIGRSALRNPFLASAIKGNPVSIDQKVLKTQQFHQIFYRYHQQVQKTERTFLNKMKEFWVYIAVQIDSSQELLNKIKASQSVLEYDTLICQLFQSIRTWDD